MDDSGALTRRLEKWRSGDAEAGRELFRAAYDELHRLAALHFRKEGPGHTLQPTALVNELYLKLFSGAAVEWQNRAHFFAVASQQIRRLLIDHARGRQAHKREGDRVRISFTEAGDPAAPEDQDLLELDEALGRLEQLDARLARVVELRFFTGLTERETAEVLGVSPATVKRDWEFARAWLGKELGRGS